MSKEHRAVLKGLDAENSKQLTSVLDKKVDINGAIDSFGNTALHIAAVRFDKSTFVQLLVECGANINGENADGKTPLHLASFFGNVETVQYLLANNALVNRRDVTGSTPLHFAGRCGSSAKRSILVELLLDAGAEFKEKDKNGLTALFYVWFNKTESLENLLLERGVGDGVVDCNDNTLLHYGVNKDGDAGVLKQLLKIGVPINGQNNFGQTALHVAAGSVLCLECAKVLLEMGADMNVEDAHGETALCYAIKKQNYAAVKLLINAGARAVCKNNGGKTALHISAIKSSEGLLDILLEVGVNVNEVDEMGNTALHLSVSHGDTCILKRLLDTDIDVDLENSHGLTAYLLALRLNKLEHAYILLQRSPEKDREYDRGEMLIHKVAKSNDDCLLEKIINSWNTNLYIKNHEGMTALDLAAVSLNKTGVLMFLSNELKVMQRLGSGNAALFKAIRRKDETLLRKLDPNCDLSCTDSTGKTALHWSVLGQFSVGVDFLLQTRSLDINKQDMFGNTALHFAALMNNGDIIKKLLTNGADVNVQNEEKKTAFHFASGSISTGDSIHHVDCNDCDDPINDEFRLIKAEGLLEVKDSHGNTPLHLAIKNNNFMAANSFLTWGASTDLINNAGESFLCSLAKCNFYTRLVILKHVMLLKEAKFENFNVGLNLHMRERILLENYDTTEEVYRGYKGSCEEELLKMMTLKIGRFRVYDVVTMTNLSFVLDEELKSAMLSTSIREQFPIYWQMLQAKFLKSSVRYRRINECLYLPLRATVSDGSEVHLPVEVKEMIFYLLSDQDLVNVIRSM